MCAFCHLSCLIHRCLLTWPPKLKKKVYNSISSFWKSDQTTDQANDTKSSGDKQRIPKDDRKKERKTDRQQRSKWNERLTFCIKRKYLFLWVFSPSLLNHIKSYEMINRIMFSDFSVSKSTSVNLWVLCISKCRYYYYYYVTIIRLQIKKKKKKQHAFQQQKTETKSLKRKLWRIWMQLYKSPQTTENWIQIPIRGVKKVVDPILHKCVNKSYHFWTNPYYISNFAFCI